MATITVEPVEESLLNANRSIERYLLDWFVEDAVAVPRVKSVKTVTAREE